MARASEWLPGTDIDPRFSAVVEETDAGVHLVVRRDAEIVGERVLELKGRACEEVREAAALALASAFDGKVVLEATVGAALPEPPSGGVAVRRRPPAATAATDDADERARPPQQGTVRRPRVTLGVDVGMLAAVLPDVAMGFEPAIELSFAPWFDLRAAVLLSSTPTVQLVNEEDRTRGDADVGLAAGRFDVCLAKALSPGTRVRGCGAIVVGAVVAEGGAVENPRSVSSPWMAASLRTDARFDAAEGFGIGLALEGFVPLVRPGLVLAGGEAAEAPFPPVGAAILAGPFYRF